MEPMGESYSDIKSGELPNQATMPEQAGRLNWGDFLVNDITTRSSLMAYLPLVIIVSHSLTF